MPRLIYRKPKYRRHKPSGLAVVTIDGVDHYLGPHGSAASRSEYRRVIAEWEALGRRSPVAATGAEISIVELIARYWRHCQSYYVKEGRPTSEVSCVKESLKPLRELYGRMHAAEFSPPRGRYLGRGRTSVKIETSRLRLFDVTPLGD